MVDFDREDPSRTCARSTSGPVVCYFPLRVWHKAAIFRGLYEACPYRGICSAIGRPEFLQIAEGASEDVLATTLPGQACQAGRARYNVRLGHAGYSIAAAGSGGSGRAAASERLRNGGLHTLCLRSRAGAGAGDRQGRLDRTRQNRARAAATILSDRRRQGQVRQSGRSRRVAGRIFPVARRTLCDL
jgi:hypothetical protein